MKKRPIDAESRRKIAKIMASMSCPKDFVCATPGFEDICSAEDYALTGYVKCMDSLRDDCPFRVPFGFIIFCRCPLRVFLKKNLDL